MSFDSPLYLLALLAVPLVVALYVVHHRRRSRVAARFASPSLLPNVVDRSPGRRRHVPPAILLIALAALLVGMARPKAQISVPREDATIMLAVDTSRSMAAKDVLPTRMDAARSGLREFLAAAPETYRVGVVSFASDARVVAPPTRDRGIVELALNELRTGEGTALGDAIAMSIEVGQAAGQRSRKPGEKPTPTTVLVVSDGKEDGGDLSPAQATQLAQRRGVPIYAIAWARARAWSRFRSPAATAPVSKCLPPRTRCARSRARRAASSSLRRPSSSSRSCTATSSRGSARRKSGAR